MENYISGDMQKYQFRVNISILSLYLKLDYIAENESWMKHCESPFTVQLDTSAYS